MVKKKLLLTETQQGKTLLEVFLKGTDRCNSGTTSKSGTSNKMHMSCISQSRSSRIHGTLIKDSEDRPSS